MAEKIVCANPGHAKLVGFLITKEDREVNIDFFKVGLRKAKFQHGNYIVHLWGLGEIEACRMENKYLFSYPLNDYLIDRNLIISIEKDKIALENDWLGSIPVFYNKKNKIISSISNFCIKEKLVHNEGLFNFCEFGYSVFEQTFFEDVKFMRYYSKLTLSGDEIEIEYKSDPALKLDFLSNETSTNEVVQRMQEYVNNIESKTQGEIVLPTSGGYDSRMLNYLVNDKSRIRSFTYGISHDQCKSTEVIHARKISEIYHTKWEQVELEDYNQYINDWFAIYGISTHLHGMYHIEFYKKILKRNTFNNPTFLSGIIGDAWAELGKFQDIKKPQDVIKLGYTHGVALNTKYLQNGANDVLRQEYYDRCNVHLRNDKLKSVFAMRTKLMLISYLAQVPEYFGMPVWTPFLNYDIVKATLNLPDEQRKNRAWEKIFFRSIGLNLEEMNLESTTSNTLDSDVAKKAKFEFLDVELLQKYLARDRLIEINTILSKPTSLKAISNKLLNLPTLGKIFRRLGLKDEILRALNEYYIVKAIEKGLKYEC